MEAAAAVSLCAAMDSKTDHIYLLGTGIWVQMGSTYMCTHRDPNRSTVYLSVSTHMNTNSTSGPVLYLWWFRMEVW